MNWADDCPGGFRGRGRGRGGLSAGFVGSQAQVTAPPELPGPCRSPLVTMFLLIKGPGADRPPVPEGCSVLAAAPVLLPHLARPRRASEQGAS